MFCEEVVGNVFFFQNFQKCRIFIKNWLFYTVSKTLFFYGFLTLFYVYFYVFLGLYVAHSSLILAMTMNFYMFLLLLNIQFFLFIAFFEFYWPYLTLIWPLFPHLRRAGGPGGGGAFTPLFLRFLWCIFFLFFKGIILFYFSFILAIFLVFLVFFIPNLSEFFGSGGVWWTDHPLCFSCV